MKKLLLSSIVLFLFAISIMIFDLSCKKDAVGQSQSTNTSMVVYLKQNSNQEWEIWRLNYDGSNKTKINFALPSGYSIYGDAVLISPDGKTLFLKLVNSNGTYLYSSNIDGANLKQLESVNNGIALTIGGCN